MSTKDQTAQQLADAHRHLDEGITRIFRLLAPDEADVRSPVKLLEVNPTTAEVGISPVGFAADPGRAIDYRTVIVEVSDGEYERLLRGELSLPHGWTIGPELSPQPVPAGAGR